MKIYIIAEAGVNHNGSLSEAKRLIDLASRAGANAVKFQTFRTELLVTSKAEKLPYQRKAAGGSNQSDMLKSLELSAEAHKALQKHCHLRGVDFLSTPFDLESIGLLHRLRMRIFKIPSGEITNVPHLRAVAAVASRVLLSTGMSTMEEVKSAVKVLMKSGLRRKDITLLHCTSSYPAALKDVNLRAMSAMRDALHCDVGYSDHTLGIDAAIAAASLGATVIEKHFTRDCRQDGPDHQASLEYDQFKAMVNAVRNVEVMLGSGIKEPVACELLTMKHVRRSIVANCPIKKGDRFTERNLTSKRPANGLSPLHWDRLMTRRASKDYDTDDLIIW